MGESHWHVVGVSRAGFAHRESDQPCQDAHAIATTGAWLVAAVSDGAGSALQSKVGAEALSASVVRALTLRLGKLPNRDLQPSLDDLRSWLEDAIAEARTSIPSSVPGSKLSDYYATLVGCVASPVGGYFFHIGDGAGCALALDDYEGAIVSKPENGEYANETYFFAQDDWRDHLRLTPFDQKKDLILLMSDGVTAFALAPGGSIPFAGFVGPVTKFLGTKSSVEGEVALAQLLDAERIRPISGDDKTLVWAVRIKPDADGG